MLLDDFISSYGGGYGYGNDLISIEGYCEECSQEAVVAADWYDSIKHQTIKRWQTIGGGIYPVEICIELATDNNEVGGI